MQTVMGIFTERSNADNAISRLQEKGYKPEDMSIMMKEEPHKVAEKKIGSKGGSATSGAIAGATTGGILGGIAGLLLGVGLITIPGVGAFLIGGPIAAILGLTGAAAATVSGATTGIFAGGILGGLIGLGVPEEVAQVYERSITEGAVFLAVQVKDASIGTVQKVFKDNFADQIRVVG